MFSNDVWKQCVEFHGHECPGLAIGVKAVEGVLTELGIDAADAANAAVECLAENDTCAVDAFRFLLGCTEENGRLTQRLTGEMVFESRYGAGGRGVRLSLKPGIGNGMPRPQKIEYMLGLPYTDMFEVASL